VKKQKVKSYANYPKGYPKTIPVYKSRKSKLYQAKLCIADIIISIKSFDKAGWWIKDFPECDDILKNFNYTGKRKPNINIVVKIVKKEPSKNRFKKVFTTIHFKTREVNWDLYRNKSKYLFISPIEHKKLYAYFTDSFDNAEVSILPDFEHKEKPWLIKDIIYNFLQVLMIHYCISRNAIFVHAAAIKDSDGKGYLFFGGPNSGKSTISTLWHEHSKALVLNDDCVILKKIDNKFYFFAVPWRGGFDIYLKGNQNKARLDKIFILKKNKNNRIVKISDRRFFNIFYANIFVPFWKKDSIGKIFDFFNSLTRKTDLLSLFFRKDKSIIKTVRYYNGKKR